MKRWVVAAGVAALLASTAETYDLGNGSLSGMDQRRVIDAGFLELTRLGELPASASPYGAAPATASIGFANGKPAGSASPLIWAQAQYLRLVTDLGSGRLGDQPAVVADRYVRPGSGPPDVLPVSVTAAVAGSRVVVTGTARSGSTVVIAAAQPAASGDATVVVSATAGADGHFRITVPLRPGPNVITAAVARGTRATELSQVTVKAQP